MAKIDKQKEYGAIIRDMEKRTTGKVVDKRSLKAKEIFKRPPYYTHK